MTDLLFGLITDFVYNELNNDYSGHDHFHAKRVYENAGKIIESMKEEVSQESKEIILIAALVHDTIDSKLFKNTNKQLKKVKKILKKGKLKKNSIKEVLNLISNLGYSKNHEATTIEEQILEDADRLDAIGCVGIIRTIEFGTNKKRKFYSFNQDDKNVTIAHFYEKLLKLKDGMHTEYAKNIALGRHQFMESFLYEFYKEIKD